MSEQAVKNLQTLADVLTADKKLADDVWAKVPPEQRMKIRNNILKRAEARKAKQKGGTPC